MAEKIFWKDPYLTKLETNVSSVNAGQITVAETIFYAFSGGQESDAGWIDKYPVLEARKQGQDIIYSLEGGHHLQTGDKVTMTIDWERRYRLMKLHFAAEIILELAYKNLKGIEKTGAHISEHKARIDFVWDENISKHIPLLEEKARELIAADLDVISDFEDEAKERRYWEVKGFAKVSCGGTHLKRTGEI